MSSAIAEITGLSEKDCFYIVERYKSEFSYPLHKHPEYELNFVQNAAGVKRVVGDSIETIEDYDLVLITAENLEHVWEQGDCKSTNIREITIQCNPNIFNGGLLDKNQFSSIRKMLDKASRGISFPMEAIMKVYSMLDSLASQKDSFVQFIYVLHMLYELSKYECKQLSSSSFASSKQDNESRRITKVKSYISEHYHEVITLDSMASLVGMSPSAFSRFFKQHTNKTLSSYIIDMRLGVAARMLVDTAQNVSEICYACGFNNLSNFNRVFRLKRGLSPREFRQIYMKTKTIV